MPGRGIPPSGTRAIVGRLRFPDAAGHRGGSMTEPEDRNVGIIREFRTNHGKVGGYFEGRPLLLLTVRGARTGAERTKPLAYLADDDRFVIFATKGGSPANPDWYHNVTANPDVTIEVGDRRLRARGRAAPEAERTPRHPQRGPQGPA